MSSHHEVTTRIVYNTNTIYLVLTTISTIKNRTTSKLDGKVARKLTAVQDDTSNLADLDKLYSVIKNEAGHLNILFANEGIFEFGTLGAITEKHFDNSFNVNVKRV
jgi:NAD(P)-dependent dehydrogenase (short-subunit alcohol dehydrogenase family)